MKPSDISLWKCLLQVYDSVHVLYASLSAAFMGTNLLHWRKERYRSLSAPWKNSTDTYVGNISHLKTTTNPFTISTRAQQSMT